MKANPVALILGALFGVAGYFLGTKITSRQEANRDAGPVSSASSVPSSDTNTGNNADTVTTEELKP